MKNPKWHRDEIILALNLYFNPDRGIVDSRNPKIIALSNILNQLPHFKNRPDAEKFRNPNGVSLKLSNFMAIDPNHEGKGMKGFSKLDEEMFNEYSQNLESLNKIASQITTILQNETLMLELAKIEEDEITEVDSVREGLVLYKLHKYRERNKKIVNLKKKSALKLTGKLSCEVCGFDFQTKYGDLGKDFIECHHIKPLSLNDSISNTNVDDLALVCSNCHRMLHRKIDSLSIDALKALLIK